MPDFLNPTFIKGWSRLPLINPLFVKDWSHLPLIELDMVLFLYKEAWP